MRSIAVFGLGYVGLPTAAVFASKGMRVVGVDVDVSKVKAVNEGICYVKEPLLDVLIKEAFSRGVLEATVDGDGAVRQCDAVVLAVPTPVKEGVMDLSFLRSALEVVRRNLRRDLLVAVSYTHLTLPTTERV